MSEPPYAGHFNRARIKQALTALGAELSRRGVRGEIFIVGGAAMALAFSTRRVTKDIDAVFEPKGAIYEAAEQVARQLELPQGWLNDAVKAFLPGRDERALALVRRLYPRHDPPLKTRLFLQELLGGGQDA